jgi:hypothetical protein
MLRLPSAAPAWLDLVQGVRVLHRPATPAEFTAAHAWARARATEAEAALRGRLAVEPSEADRANAWAGFLTMGLARLCISDWEGVEGDCTPEGCAALMQVHGMAEIYLPAAMALVRAMADEGNGSAPAPSGTTAGAPTTAEGAAPAA